jgi:hypothetical protein
MIKFSYPERAHDPAIQVRRILQRPNKRRRALQAIASGRRRRAIICTSAIGGIVLAGIACLFE